MTAMVAAFTTWLSGRFLALLGRGASVRTSDFEIRAATPEGVLAMMRELRAMPPTRPLLPSGNNDSLPTTVQAEEPMTVKG